MLALLFTLLLLGPCATTEEELLFCEGCVGLELAGADAGAGGAAGADPGEGGAGGAGGGEDGPGGAGHGGEGGEAPTGCVSDLDCANGNTCDGFEFCDDDGRCAVQPGGLPVDDQNVCTHDLCRDGLPYYEPVEIDDGDPCTRDLCHPSFGVKHYPIAGC